MMPRRLAASFLVLIAIAISALAAPKPLKVASAKGFMSVDALRPGSRFRVAIRVTIDKGYHIGAAVPKADWPSKLEVHSPKDISFSPPTFPKEELKSFEFSGGEELPVYDGEFTIFVDGKVAADAAPGPRTIDLKFLYQACSEKNCLAPDSVSVRIDTKVVPSSVPVSPVNQGVFRAETPPAKPSSSQEGRIAGAFGQSLLLGLLVTFFMGIGLSFTPCVYPMIPVTIGYFGSQTHKGTRRVLLLAGVYVLGLAITYTILGVAAALTGRLFGSALQSPYVPLAIAGVLVILALSMFGLYEIRVPSFIASKSQGREGTLGALFMGLVFGIVCAPCAGPVVLSLLVIVSNTRSIVFGSAVFFTLALGMGVPLFFLATCSGALCRLPQAGMWMISVRRIFGLLLLGAAVFYLTPLIRAHVSLPLAEFVLPAFLIVCGFYLAFFERTIGKRIRLMSGVAIIAIAVLMIGAKTISPAPMVFQPYSEAAVAKARAEHKPVMIDFGAEWCAACKELEASTFPDKAVKAEAERFVRLRADATRADSPEVLAVERKYSVIGLPTIVFLDSEGKEVASARTTEYVGPSQLLDTLRTVR